MTTLNSKHMNNEYEAGTTNVFADLDMPDADEKLAKVELAFKINQLIKSHHLKQAEAGKLLGVDQSKISLLARGRLADFSIERLVKYLNLLDQDVQIVVKKSNNKLNHGKLTVLYA